MQLKLGHLQKIVKGAFVEENSTRLLKNEVKNVLGPIIDTDVSLSSLARSVNERLDVLDRTGRSERASFKTSVIAKFVNHSEPELRKLAARVLPENLIGRFINDKNRSVRLVVARRLSAPVVKEMMKKFPNDEELRLIYAKKRKTLKEANYIDYDVPMGSASKTDQGPELSDTWYDNVAYELCQDYDDGMLDVNWEERAVNAYCEHNKATNGTIIDKEKLLNAVFDKLESRDDRVMDSVDVNIRSVKLTEQYDVEQAPNGTWTITDTLGNVVDSGFGDESTAWSAVEEYEDELNSYYDDENYDSFDLEEPHDLPSNDFKGYVEHVDPVRELVESRVSNSEFIERACELFNVRHGALSKNVKKFVLSENIASESTPKTAKIPGDIFRSIDEQALDMFCEAWNSRKKLIGESLMLTWYPTGANTVMFEAKLQ